MASTCQNPTVDFRKIILSIQTILTFATTAIVCSVLEILSILKFSSVIIEARYLNCLTTFTTNPFLLVRHEFFSAFISMSYICRSFIRLKGLLSLKTRPSIPVAKRRGIDIPTFDADRALVFFKSVTHGRC